MSSINDSEEILEESSKDEISDSDDSGASTDASEEVVSDSAETLSDSSEEIIKVTKKQHKRIPNQLISSDDEEEEEKYGEQEKSEISPQHSMRSAKRIPNPLISSDDEEEEEKDSEQDKSEISPQHSMRPAKRIPNPLMSSEDEEVEDDEEDERAISPRTRMSITGIRPADLTDDSSSDDIDLEEDQQEEPRKEVEQRRSSLKARRSPSSVLSNTNSTAERTIIEENQNSPIALRYTSIFASNVQDKLSSTVMGGEDDEKEESISVKDSSGTSTDADIKIISLRNETIEIFSSDDDAPKIIEAKTFPKTEQLLQPKIEFAMPKSVPKSATKPRLSITKDNVKYVSTEFYSKEVKKLEEIKHDLENSERVLKQCGKSLPDQGRQLEKRIESLQRDLEIKAKYVSTLKIETEAEGLKLKAKLEKEQAALKVPDWSELSAAVNSIQPKYTGKQGLATFNTQRSMTMETLKVNMKEHKKIVEISIMMISENGYLKKKRCIMLICRYFKQ